MSYQVLARKWRPRSFDQVVGQEHVLRALINGLDQDRVHHAFLFTGTRGVGKTTLGRILAKALNCEKGVSSKPCGCCGTCQEIDQGSFVDLLEVDAASRTRVEDTRELLENVQYAPTSGRYKVYLIDEVHMLSMHSFNALLKTLEEPPPHVKFLLATTDPQRLPITILSRCLQFNLKRLTQIAIAEQMKMILQTEDVTFEAAALQAIACAADGSMRDALSLLDQAITFGGGCVMEADVNVMLGTLDQEHIFNLLGALAIQDAAKLMALVATIAERAPDFSGLLAALCACLHKIALAQIVPTISQKSDGTSSTISELAQKIPSEDVQLFYQIGLYGRRDLPLTPDQRGGFEMTLLRMLSFRPDNVNVVEEQDQAKPKASFAPSGQQHQLTVPPSPPETRADINWHDMLQSLQLSGISRELARNCQMVGWQDHRLHLLLAPGYIQLRNPSTEAKLLEGIQKRFGKDCELCIKVAETTEETPAKKRVRQQAQRQQAAGEAIENDAQVSELKKRFSAQVLPGSVKPIDESLP